MMNRRESLAAMVTAAVSGHLANLLLGAESKPSIAGKANDPHKSTDNYDWVYLPDGSVRPVVYVIRPGRICYQPKLVSSKDRSFYQGCRQLPTEKGEYVLVEQLGMWCPVVHVSDGSQIWYEAPQGDREHPEWLPAGEHQLT